MGKKRARENAANAAAEKTIDDDRMDEDAEDSDGEDDTVNQTAPAGWSSERN